ncbi:MAG: preprotein translocase subunit SecE [Kiritimatiellia bacterium]|jgi:preprotein translocase subunit SecE
MKEKLKQGFGKISGFIGEVRLEIIKSTWPTRPELVESTIVVMFTVAMLSLFVWLSDLVIINVVKLLLA